MTVTLKMNLKIKLEDNELKIARKSLSVAKIKQKRTF